ncbi:adenylate kinase family enzyme [Rhizobium sp. PP-CC-2G-626]|nr:adenylate kinase family enzyme [Rhizobium sp. PP-CC-2G-626]
MKRVLIVGCPGAGKSTLARELAGMTGLPVIHLDKHYWQPGWQRPDSAAWRTTVEQLASKPAWIMDGNYSGTLETRLASADTLIHLDYPTWLCLWRVSRRTISGLGQNRNDQLAPGCPERFDWPFFRFVANYRKEQRGRDLARMEGFRGRVFRFTSPAKLSGFITAIKKAARKA